MYLRYISKHIRNTSRIHPNSPWLHPKYSRIQQNASSIARIQGHPDAFPSSRARSRTRLCGLFYLGLRAPPRNLRCNPTWGAPGVAQMPCTRMHPPHLSWEHPENTSSVCLGCILGVSSMYCINSGCILNVSWECVFSVRFGCILDVSWMYPGCIPDVSRTHLENTYCILKIHEDTTKIQ